MSDVKYIFRWLIGTIVFIVVSSLIIEVFNVSIVSVQINNLAKESAYQACTLFCQETYKDASTHAANGGTIGGTLSLQNVVYGEDNLGQGMTNSGSAIYYITNKNVYVSGDFYKTSDRTQYQVWDDIFLSNDFKKFIATPGLTTSCRNLQLLNDAVNVYALNKGLGHNGITRYTFGGDSLGANEWNVADAKFQTQVDNSQKERMIRDIYTPANIGVPYINKSYCSNIMAWEAAMIFSDCNMNNIHRSENDPNRLEFRMNEDATGYSRTTLLDRTKGYGRAGNRIKGSDAGYVSYKGFRIFAQDAKIDNVTYNVYQLANATKSGGKWTVTPNTTAINALKAKTGLNVATDGKYKEGYITYRVDYTLDNQPIYDNATVVVADVDYSIPITYEGITPLNKIVAYVENHRVGGLQGNTLYNAAGKKVGKQEVADLTQGNSEGVGVYSSADAETLGIPSSGELSFWLVK